MKKFLYPALTLIICSYLFLPMLDYIPVLAQGDLGRDLYCFERILHGDIPYKDFWWPYGPLMPYYYALFLSIFGITIKSILLGKFLIILFSCLFFYLILELVIPPIFALIGALWFFVFFNDFFYTFNHIAGVMLILSNIYLCTLYFKTLKIKYVYLGIAANFILCLIKINFGISTLFSFLISVFLINFVLEIKFTSQDKKLLLITFLSALFLISAIYYLLIKDLNIYEIRQCFPYFGSDQPISSPIIVSILTKIKMIFNNITSSANNLCMAGIVIFSIIKTLSGLKNKKTGHFQKKLFAYLIILSIFYLASLNEFLKGAMPYRGYWADPIAYLLMFIFISFALRDFSKLIRILLIVTLGSILTLSSINNLKAIAGSKKPSQFLSLERAKIYVGNSPNWIQTVTDAVNFLNANVKKDETFFALPYDPIYYYLCAKKSPTRQLILFLHNKIREEQELQIIKDLEKNKVIWVVISNRAIASKIGLGILGEDYCFLLKKYLEDNFSVVKQFGDWKAPPGWAENHSVRILKRNK